MDVAANNKQGTDRGDVEEKKEERGQYLISDALHVANTILGGNTDLPGSDVLDHDPEVKIDGSIVSSRSANDEDSGTSDDDTEIASGASKEDVRTSSEAVRRPDSTPCSNDEETSDSELDASCSDIDVDGEIEDGKDKNERTESSQPVNATTKKERAPRISFSLHEKAVLEAYYIKFKGYPSSWVRREICKKIKVDESRVRTWFQNRRSKHRRNPSPDPHPRDLAVMAAAAVDTQVQHASNDISDLQHTYHYPPPAAYTDAFGLYPLHPGLQNSSPAQLYNSLHRPDRTPSASSQSSITSDYRSISPDAPMNFAPVPPSHPFPTLQSSQHRAIPQVSRPIPVYASYNFHPQNLEPLPWPYPQRPLPTGSSSSADPQVPMHRPSPKFEENIFIAAALDRNRDKFIQY